MGWENAWYLRATRLILLDLSRARHLGASSQPLAGEATAAQIARRIGAQPSTAKGWRDDALAPLAQGARHGARQAPDGAREVAAMSRTIVAGTATVMLRCATFRVSLHTYQATRMPRNSRR